MTSYDKLKNAIEVVKPAVGELDRDLFTHCLTIIIDRWCEDNGHSNKDKSEIALEILRNLEMQRKEL